MAVTKTLPIPRRDTQSGQDPQDVWAFVASKFTRGSGNERLRSKPPMWSTARYIHIETVNGKLIHGIAKKRIRRWLMLSSATTRPFAGFITANAKAGKTRKIQSQGFQRTQEILTAERILEMTIPIKEASQETVCRVKLNAARTRSGWLGHYHERKMLQSKKIGAWPDT